MKENKIQLILFTIILIALSVLILSGCTENQRARTFGGEQIINLPVGQKIVNITWKQDNLWILTKNASKKDIPESYSFSEESSFGVWEGVIHIHENIYIPSETDSIKRSI